MATVFPVVANSGFDTTPSYSGGFIPQLWSRKLNAKFYASTILSEISNTDWEGEIKNQGDTVRIRTSPKITIRDYGGAGSVLQTQIPAPDYLDLQVDRGKYFQFGVHDVLAHQADMDLMSQFSSDAAKELKIEIETDSFYKWFVTDGADAANVGATAGLKSGQYNLGTDLAPVDTTTPDNLLTTILAMSSTLDEQNVPEDGRWLIISPVDRMRLMQTNIAQAYFTGDSSSTIRTGKIGMLDRFTVYVSNLLPQAGAGRGWVPAGDDLATGAAVAGAPARRMIVAGTKHACTFASQFNKLETLRNQTDFGDIVRGLNVYGRRVIKPTAMTTAVLG